MKYNYSQIPISYYDTLHKNWKFSDLIHKHVPKWITRNIGFLLFAQAQK